VAVNVTQTPLKLPCSWWASWK